MRLELRFGAHATASCPFDARGNRLESWSEQSPFALTCPNGALLHFKSYLHQEGLKRYRADATTCNSCPLKARCTDSDQGRTLLCSVHEAVVDRVRAS